MSKSSEIFQKSFDKAASTVKMNKDTFSDIIKYKNMMEDIEGGLADNISLGDIAHKHKVDIKDLTKQFLQGVEVEMKEHTKNKKEAIEIAMDHLVEDPEYYTKLKKIESNKKENKEATGSGSSGAYSAPLFSGEEPKSVNEQSFMDFINKVKEIPSYISLIAKIYNGSKYKSKNEFPDSEIKQDAYRHILASALFTKMIGPKLTTAGGYINEVLGALKNLLLKGQFDSGWLMDEKNNKIGIKLALTNKDRDQDFFEKIIKKIVSEGKFFDEKGKLYSEDSKKIETKEATTSGSVGAYETPAFLAKSTKKKDFRGGSKPLYKGGAFVSVKKKCTKFPYCNAGDINALNIYKNESLKEAIDNVSRKYQVDQNTVKAILQYEIEKLNNKDIYK